MLLGVLALALAPTASAAPETAAEGARDAAVLEGLASLERGELPDEVAVSSLFAVRLDRLAEVSARVGELASERDSLDAVLADLRQQRAALDAFGKAVPPPDESLPPPDDPLPEPDAADAEAAEIARAEARRAAEAEARRRAAEFDSQAQRAAEARRLDAEIAELEKRRALALGRLAYLEVLLARLRAMPEAARRILPGIAEPRAALRAHTSAISELANEVDALAERLANLRLRLESGTLVGFVRAARDVAANLETVIAEFRRRAEELRSLAQQQLRLAGELEAEARALRRTFFVTLRAPDRAARIDTLFHEHLREQRRLQRGALETSAGVDPAGLAALRSAALELAPQPARIGTVTEAAGIAELAGELVARADAVIAASAASRDAWRLAFENEVVTVLSGQISEATRQRAYALSTSLLRDVRAEAALAAGRAREGWEARRDGVPTLDALLTSATGIRSLARGLGVLAVAGLWVVFRRANARIVASGVRAVARAARRRGRVRLGPIVRWSGLVQSLLPTLLLFPAFYASLWILGRDGIAAALLVALALPFLWYAFGRQLLLGATRRITAGRPALIELPSDDRERLLRTYARLGLFVAVAAATHRLAHLTIGEGVIATLVDGVAFFWVGIWAAWEAVSWRPALARRWRQHATPPSDGDATSVPGVEARIADWMARSRLGFVLSPVALLRLVAAWIYAGLVELSRRTDIAELIQARRLRRAVRSEDAPEPRAGELPEEYLREFPLHPILGEDDALLLPREELVEKMFEQIEAWRSSRADGSIALIGEKGSGKTTLAALVAQRVTEVEVVQRTLRGKPIGEVELFRDLAPALPVAGAADLKEWIEGLCAGPERVVLLDEAHNVFLRTVHGYHGYDALIELVNATSEKIFWILIFNNFTWRFLHESRSGQHYFRKLIQVPPWSADDIRELIRRRNLRTGFEIEFDDLLLSGERSDTHGIELVEGSDGFFRLLRETSGGNPRIATRLWLASLRIAGEGKLRVAGFREPPGVALDKLSDDLLFALAAVAQHENLSTEELRQVLNVSEGLARFAVQYLREQGLVVAKDGHPDRVALSALHYRPILRALRNKHLLFE